MSKNELKDVMMRMMESQKAFAKKMEENREKRLWKEVSVPCSLSDAVNRLTKDEMQRIRQNLQLKNISSLKKAELASRLVDLIPGQFKQVICTLDQGRYGLIKSITGNSGAVEGFDMAISQAESLQRHGIVFPGACEGQKMLYMPQELVEIFLQIDGPDLEEKVRRNTEWILLTHGMLYYYGVMGVYSVTEKIKELTRQDVDILEFLNVLTPAIDFYGQVQYSRQGLRYHRVFDADRVANEHKMRPKVPYYPFTKRQLLLAGSPDYIDRTPKMNSFLSFLAEHYELSREDTDEIALQLINLINTEAKQKDIIEYLQSHLEFPSFDFLQLLVAQLMELHNNTRQWILKGHTPGELFQEERKHLKPLPSEPFRLKRDDSKVIDLSSRRKIGRNEPCPCGSGKKYKKCCGK